MPGGGGSFTANVGSQGTLESHYISRDENGVVTYLPPPEGMNWTLGPEGTQFLTVTQPDPVSNVIDYTPMELPGSPASITQNTEISESRWTAIAREQAGPNATADSIRNLADSLANGSTSVVDLNNFDYVGYYNANPDVEAAFMATPGSGVSIDSITGNATEASINAVNTARLQFAKTHYTDFGKKENRQFRSNLSYTPDYGTIQNTVLTGGEITTAPPVDNSLALLNSMYTDLYTLLNKPIEPQQYVFDKTTQQDKITLGAPLIGDERESDRKRRASAKTKFKINLAAPGYTMPSSARI